MIAGLHAGWMWSTPEVRWSELSRWSSTRRTIDHQPFRGSLRVKQTRSQASTPSDTSYKDPLEERKVSGDSFASGATFLLRPDAYAAMDLSTKANDLPARAEDLVTKAPALPYPSLGPMTRSLT